MLHYRYYIRYGFFQWLVDFSFDFEIKNVKLRFFSHHASVNLIGVFGYGFGNPRKSILQKEIFLGLR